MKTQALVDYRAPRMRQGLQRCREAKGSTVQQTIRKLRACGLGLTATLLGSGTAYAQDAGIDAVFNTPQRPSLNFYGLPGVIDTPSAEALPDGQIAVGVSNFAGITRTNVTFQVTPRISGTFRYVGLRNANLSGFETFRDRSFDVRFLANKESRYLPAVSVGLQDFAGTGIYAGEYIVATKNFEGGSVPGRIKVSAGLGWGRLGSAGSIGSPFGDVRSGFSAGNNGGQLEVGQWFRGDVAPFAGLEWQVNDKWGLKAEYSSDAYEIEAENSGIFTQRSRFNFGAEYQVSERLRIGGYYLYGAEFGVNVQLQLHPNRPLNAARTPPPAPVAQRPARSAQPGAWTTDWVQNAQAPGILAEAMKPLLQEDGLVFVALQVSADTAELRFRNSRYPAASTAVGRAARIMAQVLPPSVETFRLVSVRADLAQSAVIIRRSDLEALEFSPQAADALLAVSGIGEASPTLENAVLNEDLYPDFAWSIGPYVNNSFFDPDEPVRSDFGLAVSATYRPAPGWRISGTLQYRLAGNIGDSERVSDSAIEPVRTNAVLYARERLTLDNLYVAKNWKPSSNTYARVTAGYLERVFGGVSGEVLWKPVGSRLALGVEANYAQQRDFSGLGFQDYSVVTGHGSAYYEFGDGFLAQVDVGRYLAGDYGGTFSLVREFKSGWRLGGFFTLTDVSADDFGEGSFDKGLILTVPASWFLGKPTRSARSTTIRPILRDGGARLEVPGRLYGNVRTGHRQAIENNWSGVWE